MYSFKSLEGLLAFDFSQMRGLGNRATDDALLFLHKSFEDFFSQFGKNKPGILDLTLYVAFLEKITASINKAEESYHYKKYLTEYGNDKAQLAQQMASFTCLDSFEKIPARMQFWAAGANFADTIRFPTQHKRTVHHLNIWAKWAEHLTQHVHTGAEEEKKNYQSDGSPSI